MQRDDGKVRSLGRGDAEGRPQGGPELVASEE